jgi:hypothetical protein
VSAPGRLLAAVAAVAAMSGVAAGQQAPDTASVLTGVVLTSDGRPVANADVALVGLGTARTDSLGSFAFRGVPAGTVLLRVQRLGLSPIMQPVTLDGVHPRDVVVRFGESRTTLTPVVVRDSAVAPRDPTGFEQRRLTGQGVYFTEDYIARRRALRVEHILGSLPGLEVDTSGVVRTDRGRTSIFGDNCREGAQIFVDGVAVAGTYTLRNMSPGALRGIEVYRGVASTPVELRSARMVCGTVALWTK